MGYLWNRIIQVSNRPLVASDFGRFDYYAIRMRYLHLDAVQGVLQLHSSMCRAILLSPHQGPLLPNLRHLVCLGMVTFGSEPWFEPEPSRT